MLVGFRETGGRARGLEGGDGTHIYKKRTPPAATRNFLPPFRTCNRDCWAPDFPPPPCDIWWLQGASPSAISASRRGAIFFAPPLRPLTTLRPKRSVPRCPRVPLPPLCSGVVSGLGKGISISSIGVLLKAAGA